VTWTTYELAGRDQLIEQTGQLKIINRRHLVYVIGPVRNRNSNALYRMATLQVTLGDP